MAKETQSASTNTIRLHRVLRAAPEKVYRAFLDAEAMAKWLPPNGYTAEVHHMDAKVGGTYKMSFTNFTTGLSGPFPIEILARVAAQMRQPDRAITALQKLLAIPYATALGSNVPLTPALLRLDPMFDPLRNDPRFQKLASSAPKPADK
jgi:hypothetical protein